MVCCRRSPFPPKHPIALARYGITGIQPAERVARRRFTTDEASGLFAGLAAHSMLSLGSLSTAGYAMMLGGLGHLVGWPMARGGSQSIADSLVGVLESLGGSVVVRHPGRLARRAAAGPRRAARPHAPPGARDRR